MKGNLQLLASFPFSGALVGESEHPITFASISRMRLGCSPPPPGRKNLQWRQRRRCWAGNISRKSGPDFRPANIPTPGPVLELQESTLLTFLESFALEAKIELEAALLEIFHPSHSILWPHDVPVCWGFWVGEDAVPGRPPSTPTTGGHTNPEQWLVMQNTQPPRRGGGAW